MILHQKATFQGGSQIGPEDKIGNKNKVFLTFSLKLIKVKYDIIHFSFQRQYFFRKIIGGTTQANAEKGITYTTHNIGNVIFEGVRRKVCCLTTEP